MKETFIIKDIKTWKYWDWYSLETFWSNLNDMRNGQFDTYWDALTEIGNNELDLLGKYLQIEKIFIIK